MHDPGSRLCCRCIQSFERRFDQRLYILVSEADDAVRSHVAADHAVRQARLKWLIDDTAAPAEIVLAPSHEACERQLFRDASAQRMQHVHLTLSSAGCSVRKLHLPDTLAIITAVLFQ